MFFLQNLLNIMQCKDNNFSANNYRNNMLYYMIKKNSETFF